MSMVSVGLLLAFMTFSYIGGGIFPVLGSIVWVEVSIGSIEVGEDCGWGWDDWGWDGWGSRLDRLPLVFLRSLPRWRLWCFCGAWRVGAASLSSLSSEGTGFVRSGLVSGKDVVDGSWAELETGSVLATCLGGSLSGIARRISDSPLSSESLESRLRLNPLKITSFSAAIV